MDVGVKNNEVQPKPLLQLSDEWGDFGRQNQTAADTSSNQPETPYFLPLTSRSAVQVGGAR